MKGIRLTGSGKTRPLSISVGLGGMHTEIVGHAVTHPQPQIQLGGPFSQAARLAHTVCPHKWTLHVRVQGRPWNTELERHPRARPILTIHVPDCHLRVGVAAGGGA